jgi:enoyl-[acyl-carrier protein] reductase/trans-2-enoyl-CoA reductase (NAD+)
MVKISKIFKDKMIVKPRIKGFVCITSHPQGCMAAVREQVEIAKTNLLRKGSHPSVFS